MLTTASDFNNTRFFCFLAVLAAVLLFGINYAVTSKMTTLSLLRHTDTCLPSFLPLLDFVEFPLMLKLDWLTVKLSGS